MANVEENERSRVQDQCIEQQNRSSGPNRFFDPNFVIQALLVICTGALAYIAWRTDRTLNDTIFAANHAWLAPSFIQLNRPLEEEAPIAFQIKIMNVGREPALGVVWHTHHYGIPYVPEGTDADAIGFEQNNTCERLNPPKSDGLVIYPSTASTGWLPIVLKDSAENNVLRKDVLARSKTLVIDGCFAYRAEASRRTSAFRYYLRDVPNQPSCVRYASEVRCNWNFNLPFNGNEAN